MNSTTNPNSKTPIHSESFEERIDALKDSVRGLADLGSERADELKVRVTDAKDHAISTAQSYLARGKALIINNPLASVGIAFGVGYLGMRIFRR